MAKFNVYTGEPAGGAVPTAAQLGLEPPRFCAECGRRMIVQVRPDGWSAKCSRHGVQDSKDLEDSDESNVAPPRISRRRAVVIAVAGLTVAGALVGALWAWLAPPIHGVVALTKSGERVKAYLGNEADHFFIAAFLIVGMLGVLAVVAAVLLWQWRAHRGPVMVAALAIGSAAAAGAAAGVGAVAGALALRRDRHRRRAGVARASGALRRRGARGVLRALAAADRGDDPVSRRGRRAGLRADGGVDGARRSGCLAAGGTAGDRPACHSGERSTVRPVMTLAAIFASRAMPT